MILVIYFEIFQTNVFKQLELNNIPFIKLKYYDIQSPDEFNSMLEKNNISKVIISGSTQRILRINSLPCLDMLIENKKIKRIIGLCFGFQYLARKGGHIVESKLFKGYRVTTFGKPLWFNHKDHIRSLPDNWIIYDKVLHNNDYNIITAAASVDTRLVGFQFHPEKHNEDFRFFILPLLHGSPE